MYDTIPTARQVAYDHIEPTVGTNQLAVIKPIFRVKLGDVSDGGAKVLLEDSKRFERVEGTLDWDRGEIPHEAVMYGLTLRFKVEMEKSEGAGDANDSLDGQYTYLDSHDLPQEVKDAMLYIQIDKRQKGWRIEDLLFHKLPEGRYGDDMALMLDSPFELPKGKKIKLKIEGAEGTKGFTDSGTKRIFLEFRPFTYAVVPTAEFHY